ncbi:hypothetical protein BS1321_15500 [Peribacillus simplex NBRC 15720 = DSM 1321]|uniref:Uncharacterized protein n=3 Tax=Bacillaceae TaxID=186817 RepID=A0A223EQL5_9BACI|nr:hypothetical protein BS1321_15500 [Peribacillus simplex NBRC 15720 = DSM 1321]TVX79727.1 hypothetical protein FQP34_15680 [Peribacillus simplex]
MLIIGFTYGLIRQFRQCVSIRNGNKSDYAHYKRVLIGNYLICLSYLGFLFSYILNSLLASRIIPASFITSDNTSFCCFSFLAILLIAKFGIIPKENEQVGLQEYIVEKEEI